MCGQLGSIFKSSSSSFELCFKKHICIKMHSVPGYFSHQPQKCALQMFCYKSQSHHFRSHHRVGTPATNSKLLLAKQGARDREQAIPPQGVSIGLSRTFLGWVYCLRLFPHALPSSHSRLHRIQTCTAVGKLSLLALLPLLGSYRWSSQDISFMSNPIWASAFPRRHINPYAQGNNGDCGSQGPCSCGEVDRKTRQHMRD